MDIKLLEQLKTLNPWWEHGPQGIDRYKDPVFKRELFHEVHSRIQQGANDQIVSVVGMRQVGKSTMMRQVIRALLDDGVNPKHIFYIIFDDTFLQTQYKNTDIFERVMSTYTEGVLHAQLRDAPSQLYFFFDEVTKLHAFEQTLKTMYDRKYPVRYFITGSSAVELRKGHRESLLGRVKEYILAPFSFYEYLSYHLAITETQSTIPMQTAGFRAARLAFAGNLNMAQLYEATKSAYIELASGSKPLIYKYLRRFVVDSGFPRVWREEDNFLYRQKFLWDQQVGKVLFVDLVEAVDIRKPKELERLFTYLVDLNGQECTLPQLKERLGIKSQITLDRYINYLRDLALVYRIDKTKSPRIAEKRRSGLAKFYLTDIALRYALLKRDEYVFDDEHEVGGIAENLVCVALQNFLLLGPTVSDSLAYYRDKDREVDFVMKIGARVVPVEVKYRNDIRNLASLDYICKEWKLTESMVITKDFDMTYRDGRLSIPLWFFLLVF